MRPRNGEEFPTIPGVTLVDWPNPENLQVVGQGSNQRVVGEIGGGLIRVEDRRPYAIKAVQGISQVNDELAVLEAAIKAGDYSRLTEYGAKREARGNVLRRQYHLCSASIEVMPGQGGGLILALGKNSSDLSHPYRRVAFLPLEQVKLDLPAYDNYRNWTVFDRPSEGTFARILLWGNQLIVFAIFDREHPIRHIRQFRLTQQYELVCQFEVEVAAKDNLGWLISPFAIDEAWGSLAKPARSAPSEKTGLNIMPDAMANAVANNGGSLPNGPQQNGSAEETEEVAEAEQPKVKRQRKSRTPVVQEEKPVVATDEPSTLSDVEQLS